MRRILWPLASLAFLVLPLHAQDGGAPLTINLGGTAAVAVEASTGAGRVALGRATPGTPFTVLASALNVGKGTRVNATVDRTGPEPKLVLVPAGTSDAICEAATAEREDACQVIGGFPWGETSAIAAASVGGAVTGGMAEIVVTRTPGLPAGPATPGGFRASVGVSMNHFKNLKNTACNNAAGCSVDATGVGGTLGVEYVTPRFGVGLTYGRATNTVLRDGGQEQETTVSSFQLGANFRLGGGGGITPWLGGGAGYWQNDGDVFVDGSLITTRSNGGVRMFVKGGLDIPLSPRFSLKTGLTYAGFKKRDADAMMSGEIAVAINL